MALSLPPLSTDINASIKVIIVIFILLIFVVYASIIDSGKQKTYPESVVP